jgi:hypothetical protein
MVEANHPAGILPGIASDVSVRNTAPTLANCRRLRRMKRNARGSLIAMSPPAIARRSRLSGIFLLIEIAGGLASGSLAVLADAAHLFADVAAPTLALRSDGAAERVPTKKYTFGLYRAEILAAFVNAELLLVVMGFLFYEAYQPAHGAARDPRRTDDRGGDRRARRQFGVGGATREGSEHSLNAVPPISRC